MIKTKYGTSVEILETDGQSCSVKFIANGLRVESYPLKNLVGTAAPDELESILCRLKKIGDNRK